MALYSLSVFLETPKQLRKNRGTYIAVSFALTGMFALTASIDAAWIFELLFQSTSGENFNVNLGSNLRIWKRFLSVAALNAVIFIGDGVLVRSYSFLTNTLVSDSFHRYIDAT